MLVGAEGIGKRKIAERWGSAANPDVMIVERGVNDKDELKKNISIEQVRELIQRLSMSSFGGGKKIGIIDGAETLSTEAANALLKTLEDPMGDVLVILLATTTAAIPATVLSRCQTVYVPLVSSEVSCSALVQRGSAREVAEEIAGFASGRPGMALRLLADSDLLQTYRVYQREIEQLVVSPLPKCLGMLSSFTKISKETLENRLDVWEVTLHQKQAYGFLMRLLRARAAIRQNVTPVLALEHAFVS